MGGEFPETLNLKAGKGISNRIGDPWHVTGPNQEVMFHGDEHEKSYKVHDPGSLGVARVNDCDNTLIVAPKLKAFP